MPVTGGPIGSFAGALIGGLIGATAGGIAGSEIGEQFDHKVLGIYECLDCGDTFQIKRGE